MTRKVFEKIVEEDGFESAITALYENERPYELTDFDTL